MAKRTFLQHIQKLREVLGVADSGPSTVANQNDEFTRLIGFWNDAYVMIQNKWDDWRFMWSSYSDSTVIGQSDYSAPADLKRWDHETIKYDGNWLTVYEYEDIKRDYQFQTSNGTPEVAVIMPNGDLRLDPPPSAVGTLTADYFVSAERLTTDSQVPRIPESYQDIIIYRAIVFFGEYDEQPVTVQSGINRYNELMPLLEGNQLPNTFGAKNRQDSGRDLVMVAE